VAEAAAVPGDDGTDPFGEFAARFAEAWAAPTPGRLSALLTDDVVLIQPLAPTARGRAEAERAFGRLLELVPDIHAEVFESWGDAEGGAITFDLIGTLGGSELRWHLVDVFELRDGLGSKRTSYFDPSTLAKAVATRPKAWLPFAGSGLWRR
jgi:hypothetical protein